MSTLVGAVRQQFFLEPDTLGVIRVGRVAELVDPSSTLVDTQVRTVRFCAFKYDPAGQRPPPLLGSRMRLELVSRFDTYATREQTSTQGLREYRRG